LKVGSGGVLDIGGVKVKASSASRQASINKIEDRLGPYEEANITIGVAGRTPEPVEEGAPLWSTYIERRNFFYESRAKNLAEQKARQKRELKETIDAAKHRLIQHQRSMRDVGKRRSRSKDDVSLHALRTQHIKERALMRAYFRPFPLYATWLKEQGHDRFAELWRKRFSSDDHDVKANSMARIAAIKEIDPDLGW
jgi:hypothetical protein